MSNDFLDDVTEFNKSLNKSYTDDGYAEEVDDWHKLYKDYDCTDEAYCPISPGYCIVECAIAVNIGGPKRYRCGLINAGDRDTNGITLYRKTESSGKVSDGRYH